MCPGPSSWEYLMWRGFVGSCWLDPGCPVLRANTQENPVCKNGVMTVRVSKLFMHILLGLVQTDCLSLEPALLHNFSVYLKFFPSVGSHASTLNPNFRFCPLCPGSRQLPECLNRFSFKIFQNPFEKFAPVCCQI